MGEVAEDLQGIIAQIASSLSLTEEDGSDIVEQLHNDDFQAHLEQQCQIFDGKCYRSTAVGPRSAFHTSAGPMFRDMVRSVAEDVFRGDPGVLQPERCTVPTELIGKTWKNLTDSLFGQPPLPKLLENGMYGAILQNTAPSLDGSARHHHYLPFKDHDEAASHILSMPQRERTFTEVIRGSQPHMVFFDVDFKYEDWEGLAVKTVQDNLITDWVGDFGSELHRDMLCRCAVDWICGFFAEYYFLVVPPTELLVMTANRKDKVSYHIVVTRLFWPNASARFQFRKEMEKSTLGKEIIGMEIFDAKVYNNGHRTMRGVLVIPSHLDCISTLVYPFAVFPLEPSTCM